MDFTPFDKHGYPVVSGQTGYGEWAGHYEATVAAGLDRPLLDALKGTPWNDTKTAADLACGTGRTGCGSHNMASDSSTAWTSRLKCCRSLNQRGCIDTCDVLTWQPLICPLQLRSLHARFGGRASCRPQTCLSGSCAVARLRRIFRSNRISPILSHERNADSLSSGRRRSSDYTELLPPL